MIEAPSQLQLESEIQSLLTQHQNPDVVADQLLQKYQSVSLAFSDLKLIATFLLYCGFYSVLNEFLLSQLKKNSEIPWAHFTESLFLMGDVNAEITQALYEGAKEQQLLFELSRTHFLDGTFPELATYHKERKQQLKERIEARKNELMVQAEMLKSQQLVEEEQKIYDRLALMFPDDLQIQQLSDRARELKALNFLSDRSKPKSRKLPLEIYQSKDPEILSLLDQIEASQHEILADTNPPADLAFDFAMSHFMWENFEATLSFLTLGEPSQASQWFKLEVYLKLRRFVDLLNELNVMELQTIDDPEASFAITYLRAQALWGLGDKFSASEMMESIVTVRPHYRAAASILLKWKEEML